MDPIDPLDLCETMCSRHPVIFVGGLRARVLVGVCVSMCVFAYRATATLRLLSAPRHVDGRLHGGFRQVLPQLRHRQAVSQRLSVSICFY